MVQKGAHKPPNFFLPESNIIWFDSQSPSSHHCDLSLDDITAVRQDGKDGGRVQKPVNHVDDPVGRHNVGARQMDALLAQ